MITHFSIKSIKYDVIEIQGRSMSYSTFSDIDFEMAWVQSTLNTNLRAIHTIATISIAIHAVMSWQVIVKNTLENFYAGGVMINLRYQFVVLAGDRSKDALSEPWTRWVIINKNWSNWVNLRWIPRNFKIFVLKPKLSLLRGNHKNDYKVEFHEFTLYMMFQNFNDRNHYR